MNKIFLSALILLFSNSFTWAKNEDVFSHQIATDKVEMIRQEIPQLAILRGNFAQEKTIKDIDKKFITNGKFIFVNERGLYWRTIKPVSSVMVFSKNGIAKIENEKKDVLPLGNNTAFQEFSQIFQSIFAGDTKILSSNFEIFFKKSQNHWILGLKPTNETIKDSLRTITITGDSCAREIIITEYHGDITKIKFSKIDSAQKPLTKDEAEYFNF